MKDTGKSRRCEWAKSPLLIEYHDREWGVPLHDDRKLFELLTLEGAQAGLSWETVLNKRENYRRVFADFDPVKIARYDNQRVRVLLRDPGIVRNRLKIGATITNARAFLAVKKEYGSFDRYIWQFASGKQKGDGGRWPHDVATRTAESDAMSKDLKKRGFRFVGTTICYAFMQAAGMVNDHAFDCFRRKALESIS
jgi:DNA-3-methyladenine glycosylase I